MPRLIVLACIAFVVVGLGQLTVGAVMEPMVAAYGVQYGDGGQLVMHQFLGGMVGVMFAPWLIGKIGKRRVLLSALAILTLAEIVYACRPPWAWMLTAAPFAGLGSGTTEAVVASFIIGAAGKNANVAMSRVEVSFGVGALLMPFVGAALIDAGRWDAAFAVVAVLAGLTLALWTVRWPRILDRPVEPQAEQAAASERTAPSRLRIALILLAGAFYFAVYVGFEISFANYFPSLLVQNGGVSDATASLSLSVFWGAMVLGRLVSGHAADRWGSGAYMIVTCASAAILFVIMGAVHGANGLFVLTFFVGLVMSGMYSIALVFVNRAIPGRSERTTSFMMVFGGIGGALMPKLTGWFLDENGADATRWLFAVIAAVMLAAIVWVLCAAPNRKRMERSMTKLEA